MSGPPGRRADDIGRAARIATVLGLVFATAALMLHGPRAASSVAVGAGTAIANLLTMRAIIRKVLGKPEPPPEDGDAAGGPEADPQGGSVWGFFAVLKIFILFGGLWILLTCGLVDPIPLVVGYGVLPLGIVGSTLGSASREG